ncbi:hypothetical protein ACFL23_01565 [Patescibacteria group bacterium]
MAGDKGFFNKFFTKIGDFLKKVFKVIGFVALIGVAVTFICWIFGERCNYGLLSVLLIGVWALVFLLKDKGTIAKEIGKAVVYYIGFVIVTISFFQIFFASTLFYMYGNWQLTGRGLVGFFQIFAPVIGLVASAILLSVSASGQKWSSRWMSFALIMCVFGIMGYRLICPLDLYLEEKVIACARYFNADRLNERKNRGLYAIIERQTPVFRRYENEDKNYPWKEPNSLNSIRYKPFLADDTLTLSNGTIVELVHSNIPEPEQDDRGVDFMEVYVKVGKDIENRYVKSKDVRILRGEDIQENEDCTIIKKSENEWQIIFLTNKSILIKDYWALGLEIEAYYNSSDSNDYPEIYAGKNKGYIMLFKEVGIMPSQAGMPLKIRWSAGKEVVLKFSKHKI